MRFLLGFFRTAARILVGSILCCSGIVAALSCARLQFQGGGGLELAGELTVYILFMGVGVVGFKMVTRRSLPRKTT
jgi:hypothetical protein